MANDLSFLNNLNPTQKTPSNTQKSSDNSKKNNDAVSDFIKNFKSLMGVVGKVTEVAGAVNPVAKGVSMVNKAASSIGDVVNNSSNQTPRMLVDESGTYYDTTSDAFKQRLQQTNDMIEFKTPTGMSYEIQGVGGANNAEQQAPAESGTQTVTETQKTTPEEDEDTIEYIYKRGDTFGQVIKDLGLKTDKGLWGSDGDVAYYTKQLREQGIPGMVPIGKKIRLKRRK